jgi:hypothetical protein
MRDVLEHDFFNERAATHSQMEAITAGVGRLEESAAKIIKMSETTQAMVKNSTSTLCTAIFEANEVSTPSCFVILPYELPPPDKELSEEEEETMLDKAESWVETVSGLADEGGGLVENAAQYAKSFFGSAFKDKIAEVKGQLTEKTLYLYLVDEYTGKPVYDESCVYPVQIDVASDLVDRYMPMMKIGLQAVAVANGAAALASMFYPFPKSVVPAKLLAKATSYVDHLDKGSNVADFSSVQDDVDASSEGGSAKRGCPLRDFKKFLLKHDPDVSYAGLMRVCDERDGHAIWVTEESAESINFKTSEEFKDLERENKDLEREIEQLKRRLGKYETEG